MNPEPMVSAENGPSRRPKRLRSRVESKWKRSWGIRRSCDQADGPSRDLVFLRRLWSSALSRSFGVCLYFPAACVVASFTKSFVSAVNPMIGLDTVRRMGGCTYVKLLFTTLALGITLVFVSAVVGSVFEAFDVPGMGDIPSPASYSAYLSFTLRSSSHVW